MLGHASLVGLVEDSDEDHAAFVRLARREAPDVEIVRWSSSEDLVQALEDLGDGRRPDVLVVDLNLPGMDGCELVAHLRADPSTRAMPAFVLSGSDRQVDIDRCYAAGANAYLTKPGSAAELRALVRMLFRTLATFKTPSAPHAGPDQAADASAAVGASGTSAVAPPPAHYDQAEIDAERELYEAELRAERDRERLGRQRAEQLQRLTSRLANAGDARDVERELVAACRARPGEPTARIVPATAESEAQGAMFMPDPFGDGTIAILPLRGHGAVHHGTLRVETATDLDDDTEAFLHAAASLASQALARVGRVNELAHLARTAVADLPTERWWREAIEAVLARSRRSGDPVSLVVVLPVDLDGFDAEHGPVQGDERVLALLDAWRIEGHDLLSPSGAERWVAIVDGRQSEADAVVARVAGRLGEAPVFVAGSAQWDRREDAETLLFRAATAVARDAPSSRA